MDSHVTLKAVWKGSVNGSFSLAGIVRMWRRCKPEWRRRLVVLSMMKNMEMCQSWTSTTKCAFLQMDVEANPPYIKCIQWRSSISTIVLWRSWNRTTKKAFRRHSAFCGSVNLLRLSLSRDFLLQWDKDIWLRIHVHKHSCNIYIYIYIYLYTYVHTYMCCMCMCAHLHAH